MAPRRQNPDSGRGPVSYPPTGRPPLPPASGLPPRSAAEQARDAQAQRSAAEAQAQAARDATPRIGRPEALVGQALPNIGEAYAYLVAELGVEQVFNVAASLGFRLPRTMQGRGTADGSVQEQVASFFAENFAPFLGAVQASLPRGGSALVGRVADVALGRDPNPVGRAFPSGFARMGGEGPQPVMRGPIAPGPSTWDRMAGARPTGPVQSFQDYAQSLAVPSAANPFPSTPSSSGPGGFGVGAPPASTIPDPATMNEAELDAYVRQTYGYMSWALDHPEVGPIIRQAAREGWDANRLQGAISETVWYRSTSEVSRNWTAFEATDPATAEQQIVSRTQEVTQAAIRMGADVSATRARQIARDSLRFGWDPATVNSTLVNEIKYRPGTADSPQGQLALNMQQAKALAAQFLTPLSDATALDYARRMLLGNITPDVLAATFAQQAKARFPSLSTLIDQGVTPGDYFAPYKEVIATELEVDPGQVDLVNDSRWTQVIEYNPGGGGSQPLRPMTLSEARQMVRQRPEWDTTKRANDMAAQFAYQLGRTFGVVA